MRRLLAAIWIGLSACSVYDDSLLRAGSTPDAALVRPPPAAGATAQASAGSAAPGLATSAGSLAADGGNTTCVKNAPSDYCAALPALTHPPQIDGALECGLTLAPVPPAGWRGPSDAPGESASYAAAWSPQGLYVYVEVHGGSAPHTAEQPIFCGDAVELFVDSDAQWNDDGSYDPSGTMQFVIAAPAIGAAAPAMDAQRFVQGKPQGAWVTPALRVSALADGYSVEALIGGADLGLWQWSPATQLGFSIGLDLAPAAGAAGPSPSGCAEQAGQFFLRVTDPHADCDGGPWCDTHAFCSAQLL
jgi:hypothetical protein